MKVLDVLDGGMLTTVQDRGRFGFQRYGVPTSGPLDAFSMRAANRLVGNGEDEAGLEMTLIGPRLRFAAPAAMAITGADLGARLDDRPAPLWESLTVEPGVVLSFTGPREGIRACLAIAGGVDVPLVLGSRATYTRARLGGLEGRPLRAGDSLAIRAARPVLLGGVLELPARLRPAFGHEHVLRVVLGPQDDRFTREGVRTFLSEPYTVTPQSDRMGCRLAGAVITHSTGPDIVSDGTPLGAVQVAGDGMPIVLLADRGTAGGYTKIATVIGPDLCALAQAAPGDTVRFEAVALERAYDVVRQKEEVLSAIRPKPRAPSSAPSPRRLRQVAAAVAAVSAAAGRR